ncbi:MAG: Sir2 family NAD-dependent protein deacetylase [Cloacibacillus evryensis]
MSVEEDAKRLARLVKEGGVTIFSGAGLSTESGLQDFRSRDGIWAHADPTRPCPALEDNMRN